MSSMTDVGIDLFAEEVPSLDGLKQVSTFVHSSERNREAFRDEIEENMSRADGQACLSVGIGLYILGQYAEAVDKLEKGKDCEQKFIYLAYALRKLGRFSEAIENLEKSLKACSDALLISLEKAATYCEDKDFESAEKEIGSCANFENVSADYHLQLGQLKEARGLYDEAIENYETALELSPNHQEALFRLAYRCDLLGDDEAAIDYYKQIGVRSPGRLNALLNLAVLYEDREEYDSALRCVDKILQFHPNHRRAILFHKDIESAKTMYYDEEREKRKDRKNKILETPLTDFELSVRSRNCFKKMGIRTLGDLLRISESELLSYKNFGETSLHEIKATLASKGLHLGAALEGESEEEATEEQEAAEEEDESILSKSIDELNLSIRAQKCLQKLNVNTLEELTQKTEAELLGCKNFGVTSLIEIKKALDSVGLSLRTLE